jgi:hypothetical protein
MTYGEDNVFQLNKLKGMLHVEKKGSMVDVLVTTRSETIAKKNICTDEPQSYNLYSILFAGI